VKEIIALLAVALITAVVAIVCIGFPRTAKRLTGLTGLNEKMAPDFFVRALGVTLAAMAGLVVWAALNSGGP